MPKFMIVPILGFLAVCCACGASDANKGSPDRANSQPTTVSLQVTTASRLPTGLGRTITVDASCSSESEAAQLASLTKVDSLAVMEGFAKPTGRTELVKTQDNADSVVTEFSLSEVTVLRGAFDPAAVVWVEGGTADGVTMAVSRSPFYAADDGRSIIVTAGDHVADHRPVVIDSHPVIGDRAVVGLGCLNGKGFATEVYKGTIQGFSSNGAVQRQVISAFSIPKTSLINLLRQ